MDDWIVYSKLSFKLAGETMEQLHSEQALLLQFSERGIINEPSGIRTVQFGYPVLHSEWIYKYKINDEKQIFVT